MDISEIPNTVLTIFLAVCYMGTPILFGGGVIYITYRILKGRQGSQKGTLPSSEIQSRTYDYDGTISDREIRQWENEQKAEWQDWEQERQERDKGR